jgi:hypothetical protein
LEASKSWQEPDAVRVFACLKTTFMVIKCACLARCF